MLSLPETLWNILIINIYLKNEGMSHTHISIFTKVRQVWKYHSLPSSLPRRVQLKTKREKTSSNFLSKGLERCLQMFSCTTEIILNSNWIFSINQLHKFQVHQNKNCTKQWSLQESNTNTYPKNQTYCIALQPEKLMIYSDWRALVLTHKGITDLCRKATTFTKKASVLSFFTCKSCRCFPKKKLGFCTYFISMQLKCN